MGEAKPYLYLLELHCARLAAEVTLGGWHAYRATDPEARTAQVKLNPWLLEGESPFEVAIGPLGEEPPPDDARLFVRVYKTVPDSEQLPFDDMLLYYRWDRRLSPLSKTGLTTTFRHSFQLREAFGPFAWQSAQPFVERDRADIEALVAELHDALARKDEAAILAMQQIKLEEYARALHLRTEELADEQRMVLQFYFQDDPVQVKPLARGQMQLVPTAGGRLVDVWAEDGSLPIEASFGGKPFEFPLTVSNLGGQWTIVR